MSTDLGTYHVRVELVGGDGFIQEWHSGPRYTNGGGGNHPLDAMRIPPSWRDEEDLASTVEYAFLDGNSSCDCNLRLYLARAHQREEPEDGENPCGETLVIERLTLIRPDGTERPLELRR